jgi:hypothetical protein
MRIRLSAIEESELSHAVEEFNLRYGEMERVLWCLSQHCREPLIRQEASAVIEGLVWTVKSWWGVQGVRRETKAAMSRGLASFDWSQSDFEPIGQTRSASSDFRRCARS